MGKDEKLDDPVKKGKKKMWKCVAVDVAGQYLESCLLLLELH